MAGKLHFVQLVGDDVLNLMPSSPAGILIAWIIMGIMLISTVQNIGEMAVSALIKAKLAGLKIHSDHVPGHWRFLHFGISVH